MNPAKCIGSLIGLKAESTDPYIILHKNAFPAVLERIARSNISNYSIFLADGILFGFYDYLGVDYKSDLQAMEEDPDTQQWWKLTAPMQVPLPLRKQGEWWAGLKHIGSFRSARQLSRASTRKAYRINFAESDIPESFDLDDGRLISAGISRIEIFAGEGEIYIYTEDDNPAGPDLAFIFKDPNSVSNRMYGMQKVFHTEGCVQSKKKVFVTGCFDMLHSGHVAFLKEASSWGDLYVGIGSDANVSNLKGRYPVNSEAERKYMLESVRYVHRCVINKGWGIMDFRSELDEIRPDVFIVNEDGHTPDKEELCQKLGIEYKVLRRIPEDGLPVRSTTSLRTECRIPFRIDLAGGWLDQPFVSKHFPGPVLTISIEPTLEFNDRSGMASSTRKKAIELWKTDIPPGDPEKLAKVLFSYDNPPGTPDVSGSQDALGIVLPGLNRLDYHGSYWPEKITGVQDENVLQWVEEHLFLVTLGPRDGNYTVVSNSRANEAGARDLAVAADNCWKAILDKDLQAFGKHFRASFDAQVAMFPNMADESIYQIISHYRNRALGWKLSGAGGGGYLILVSGQPIDDAIRIKIRRRNQFSA